MPRRPISGVLLLDKPVSISSNHALQAVKRLLRAEKAGHAGTLDPLASGLLPVLLGDATKFSGYLLDAAKGYEAELRLGVTTTTADAEGEILETHPVSVTRQEVDAVVARFLGAQTQIPPMYSALKRNGTPLYVLARRGENVERKPRAIELFKLDLLEFSGDRVTLRVLCSKGTYIRTLAEDIGAALGCGAHLCALRRTATGPFSIHQAVTLDSFRAMTESERESHLAPPDVVLHQLPRVDLDWANEARFGHGQAVEVKRLAEGTYRAYGESGRFLGIAVVLADGRLTPRRLLADTNKPAPSS